MEENENAKVKMPESENKESVEELQFNKHLYGKMSDILKEDSNALTKKEISKDGKLDDFCLKRLSLEEVETALEITYLKEELQKVSEQLRKEKDNNIALKIAIQQNNDGFKKIQDVYIQEIKMLQSVLNRKQIQHIYGMRQQKERQNKNYTNNPIKDNMLDCASKSQKSCQEIQRNQSPVLRNFEEYQNISKNNSLPSNLNKIGVYNSKLEKKRFRSIGNLNNIDDENSCKLNRKLSSIEMENNEYEINVNIKEMPVQRKDEESILKKELEQLKHKLSQPCEMCKNYEIQLQQKQKIEQQQQKELDNLQNIQEQYKQDLNKEQMFRSEMEQKANELAKTSEKQTLDILKKLESTEKLLHKLKSDYSVYKDEIQQQLKYLCNSSEELKAELTRLTMENDILLGKHIMKAQELMQEIIDMPNDLEEIQFYCLKLREELITSLVNKETIENQLKSEILFINDQMKAEQYSKELLIKELTQEIDNLREQIVNFDNIKKNYEEALSKHSETEYQLSNLKSQFQLAHQKILDQERMLEEYSIMKENSEMQIQLLKSNIQNLQCELENSELVQKDFVKLSQSLQMELENIRQSNTEVRWQHEDDVTNCLTCKLVFHSSKEKIHCSHCGKIFCNNCCSKIVHGGPRSRPFNVCSVCYTLLDQDSAPYFSSEALASYNQ